MASKLDSTAVRECIVKAIQTLGYDYPTKEQLEAVGQFVTGRDVFVSLPTGSGKSVCYACLPLVFDSLHQRGRPSIVIVIAHPMLYGIYRPFQGQKSTVFCIRNAQSLRIGS